MDAFDHFKQKAFLSPLLNHIEKIPQSITLVTCIQVYFIHMKILIKIEMNKVSLT